MFFQAGNKIRGIKVHMVQIKVNKMKKMTVKTLDNSRVPFWMNLVD